MFQSKYHPKICIRLAGGLGNQLFQLAAGIDFHKKYSSKLYISTAGLKNYNTIRNLELNRLFYLTNWCCILKKENIFNQFLRLASETRCGRWFPIVGVNDSNFEYRTKSGCNRKLPLILDGYFQYGWTFERFDSVRKEIMGWDYTLQAETMRHECVIHIRGGDFLKVQGNPILTTRYYESALQLLSKKLGGSEFKWICITDDIYHASSVLFPITEKKMYPNFLGFHNSIDLRYDFDLIRQARSRIIGNSTFAWWAMVLDENQSVTISPSKTLDVTKNSLVMPWEFIMDFQ